jgi:hypothetical protein
VNLLVRILLWTGITGLVLVGLIEGVMWLFFPAPKRINQTFEFENDIPGLKKKVSFSMDQRYLRSWTPENSGTGKEIHIVCIGGSATSAILQNGEDTWWGRMAAELQKQFPGARFRVSAFGIEQRGILHAARWAQENLPDIHPDIVISMHGMDDIFLHSADYTYDPGKLNKIKIEGPGRGGLRTFVINASQICRRISNARQKYAVAEKMRVLRETNYFTKVLRTEQALRQNLPVKYEIKREQGHDPLAEYLDGIKALADASKKAGSAFIVVGEPSLNTGLIGSVEERLLRRRWLAEPARGNKGVVRIDSGGVEMELNRYQREAQKLCQQEGIPFLPLHGKVETTRDNFVDDVILTDVGAAAVARLILPVVKPLVAEKL